MTTHGHRHGGVEDGCYWCALLDGNRARTPAQAHVTAPQDDEPTTDAPPNRLPSTKPADTRLRNLAQSHAHEAHRIADNSRDAGLIHAHLAIAYALLAREERP